MPTLPSMPDCLAKHFADGSAKYTDKPEQPATGEVPAKRKRSVERRLSASWTVILRPDTVVVSELNRRDHWAVKSRRKGGQQKAVNWAWNASPLIEDDLDPPLLVTLVHIGRKMDSHDNLRSAFKGIADQVSYLIGFDDDGDGRIEWQYEQRTGPKGVEIRIEPAPNPKGTTE